MADYNARFEIDGATGSMGCKSSAHYEEDRRFDANNDNEAVVDAAKWAARYSLDGLSNPETNKTTVKILEVRDASGRVLNQELLLEERTIEVEVEGIPGRKFQRRVTFDGECAVFEGTLAEHMRIAYASARLEEARAGRQI